MAKLKDAEYLHIGKRRKDCVACGTSLSENPKHPSVLVQQEEVDEWEGAEKVMPAEDEETPEPVEKDSSTRASSDGSTEESAPKESKKKNKQEDEPEFIRLDYCDACWAKQKEQAFFSFWIAARKNTDQPKKKLNRTERNLALQALFDSLSDHNGDENDYTPHLYFIAHLLMKYKLFKWTPSIEDPDSGQHTLRFLRTDTEQEEEVLIPELDMQPEQIAQVRDEIQEYLLQATGQEVHL